MTLAGQFPSQLLRCMLLSLLALYVPYGELWPVARLVLQQLSRLPVAHLEVKPQAVEKVGGHGAAVVGTAAAAARDTQVGVGVVVHVAVARRMRRPCGGGAEREKYTESCIDH